MDILIKHISKLKFLNRNECGPACLIVLLVLLLFTTRTLALVPIFIVSLFGFYLCVLKRDFLTKQHLLLYLFLCLWIPVVVSLPDAFNQTEVLRVALTHFFFPFFALSLIYFLAPGQTSSLSFLVVLIMLFWCFDGLIQFFYGTNLFGYPYTPPQLKGMFYPKVRMPYILAVLAPVFFEWLRVNGQKHKWTFILLIPFLIVLLLGGKRVSWFMFLGSSFLYLVYLFFILKSISIKKIILFGLFLLITTTTLCLNHAPLKNRVVATLNVFSADVETIDRATARRLSLWEVSYDIFLSNPINGVGPRSFRDVFTDYANEDNFWVQNGRNGSTHPHMMLAEIAAETGVIGLSGLLLFYLLLFLRIKTLILSKQFAAIPWYLCSLTAFFPLNSHLAFYGSYWSSFCWWILAVTLAIDNAESNKKNINH